MTKRTFVTLCVTDDQEDRSWWEALGLPDPDRWNEGLSIFDVPFERNTHVYPVLVVEQSR